jgi:hypothetical protein
MIHNEDPLWEEGKNWAKRSLSISCTCCRLSSDTLELRRCLADPRNMGLLSSKIFDLGTVGSQEKPLFADIAVPLKSQEA